MDKQEITSQIVTTSNTNTGQQSTAPNSGGNAASPVVAYEDTGSLADIGWESTNRGDVKSFR